ncbi:MAG: glycoside hydrolase family 3 N-terminal domain-containing protein [Gemmatimonadota bacterium]
MLPSHRIRLGAGLLGLFLLTLAACAPVAPPAPDLHPPSPVPTLLDHPDPDGQAWVAATLADLTLREAVGQLVFPWISGAYAAEDDPEFLETLGWVEEEGIGGVVISIGTPHTYADKLNQLQRRAGVPLLVTSDFEQGGPGMRIAHSYALPTLLPQGGGTSFPPTMAFGAIGEEGIVERFAEATAREARAVGVHVVFAPVMDVNSNPENPIINTRAFGEDPQEVSRLGSAFIRGARTGGAMSTAKHFPGHGDTRIDSHLELPEVTADRARLDQVELVPFRAAIEAGVDGVMTAHVSVPGVLGPGAPPATLAPEFMTELLQEEMGFQGLVFTDALRMGAITEGYGAGEAAVLAFEAGSDVIVIPASVSGAVDALVDAVESGRISRERLDRSVRRILETKARAGLHRNRLVSLDEVSSVVGGAAHRELAAEAAARSITLVRDRDLLLPPDPESTSRILSITWAEAEDLTAGREFDAVLSGLLPGVVEAARVGPHTDGAGYAALLELADGADLVLLGVYLPPRAGAGSVALPPAFREFARRISERDPAVLVSFGNPYLLAALPETGTYMVAWGDREVSQRAAARAVLGAEPMSGRLPISIPPLHQRGEGIARAAHPLMEGRDELRGDALDEAGLLRHDPGGAEPPPDSGTAAGGLPGGVLPPASGARPPFAWFDLPRSPVEADPLAMRLSPEGLSALDRYIEGAIADSVAPGVALAVGRGGRVARLRGYGRVDWDPDSPPVTPHTLYDLASLTKVVGTTTAIMALEAAGRLHLEEQVVDILPGFARGDARKESVTLRDLLLHRSGLPPYRQFFLSVSGPEEMREAVYDLQLDTSPGERTAYSDIGFIVLAWVAEAVGGEPFASLLDRRVFAPLGMDDTMFNPPPHLLLRIAPTEVDRERRFRHIHGEVHDANALAAGGVAGHAGLFSSAADLAVFVQLLAEGGALGPCGHVPGSGEPCNRARHRDLRLFSSTAIESYAQRWDPSSSRALGWDTPSDRSSAGEYFSERSFGHTGFTGTSIWIDPELDLWVVLLTNRVNPSSTNSRHIPFRRDVHDLVAGAVVDREVRPR